jgi:hypothetical protein
VLWLNMRDQAPEEGLIGNPVQVGSGPAAVTGDERSLRHCPPGREGRASRRIRKPEDLPGAGNTPGSVPSAHPADACLTRIRG